MSVVYKVTNIKNNKLYIGRTNNISKRKRDHISESFNKNHRNYNTPFHKAIRRYGKNNFKWEIISDNNSDKTVRIMEMCVISILQHEGQSLYNIHCKEINK